MAISKGAKKMVVDANYHFLSTARCVDCFNSRISVGAVYLCYFLRRVRLRLRVRERVRERVSV